MSTSTHGKRDKASTASTASTTTSSSSSSSSPLLLLDPATTLQSLCTGDTPLLDARLVKALQQQLRQRSGGGGYSSKGRSSAAAVLRPTLVQAHVWPTVLQQGRSCLIQAPTGSGKTLAYLVPILQKIIVESTTANSTNSTTCALILVPTRELCHQVERVVKPLLQAILNYNDNVNNQNHCCVLSVGRGRGKGNKSQQQQQQQQQQAAALRDNPVLVIATPAACAAALEESPQFLRALQTLVLDEADLLLSLGYETDLRTSIAPALPRRLQGIIVSATLGTTTTTNTTKDGGDNNNASSHANVLPTWMLTDPPVTIQVEPDESQLHSSSNKNKNAPQLKQLYLPCAQEDKFLVLYVFLKLGLLQGKGLFFVQDTNAAYALKLKLQLFHIRASVLNATLPVASRLHILQQYHVGNIDYLIATDDESSSTSTTTSSKNDKKRKQNDNGNDSDDATTDPNHTDYGVSRGIDFHRVSFVVNVDFPTSPTVYRHRIGRTARAGRAGVALSLVRSDHPNKAQSKSNNNNNNNNNDWDLLEAVQADQPCLPLAAAAASARQGLGHHGGGVATSQNHLAEQANAAGQEAATASSSTHMVADQPQPVPLEFDLHELEGFRYRVTDVCRAVTRKAIREARMAELKAEILNSERLAQHFAENPADAKVLQHDRATSAGGGALLQAPDHLKHVPKYLLPAGMQVANLHKKRKRKKINKLNHLSSHTQYYNNKDPLQSFQADDVNLEGVSGAPEEGNERDGDYYDEQDEALAMNDANHNNGSSQQQPQQEPRVFSSTRDGTGKSTAGRNAWKERHRKGKFSNKKHKSERRSDPLGI